VRDADVTRRSATPPTRDADPVLDYSSIFKDSTKSH